MNEKPLVTVTVCARNGAHWVEDCLDAIHAQTHRPLEIIAVNDKLEESPELVNESPYGSGWMVVIDPSEDMSALIDAESYKNSLD